ncbi:hypothetical protein [Lactonifactor longoviformis]|uniref:hypothetical protein n=1 Tax=Lactonifactor longoviformis TaxID=341220 RepID=UPI001D006FA5|nr:hypothetical protein [Lactonifactor longoviformis]MCB5711490.1 hypothetical protein [Lactonifactor longoviformis]MCB5715457.1 hypothetical protein [Lactonifactor longoviformis]
MIKKKIAAAVLIATLVIGTAVIAFASEKVLTYPDDFSTTAGTETLSEAFSNMLPGETRAQTVELKNVDSDQMKFYMYTEITENLADKGDQNAIYTLELQKAGETEPFFSGIIGKDKVDLGKDRLTEDNQVLLDSLKKGQKSEIIITINLDGDSAENTYENESGTIKMVFSASEDNGIPTIQKIRKTEKKVYGAAKTITKVVKTGDEFPVEALLALAGISLAVITMVILKRKKKVEDEI